MPIINFKNFLIVDNLFPIYMYEITLIIHSIFRWLVLASLLLAVYNSLHGWLSHKPFMQKDDIIRSAAVIFSHIQFTIGLVLYVVSPVARYFLKNFSEAVHNRDIRFFGMEHILMMIIAVAVITHGSAKAKRKQNDVDKFRTVAIWYSIALLIILISIPWPFSPFTARPYLRY